MVEVQVVYTLTYAAKFLKWRKVKALENQPSVDPLWITHINGNVIQSESSFVCAIGKGEAIG